MADGFYIRCAIKGKKCLDILGCILWLMFNLLRRLLSLFSFHKKEQELQKVKEEISKREDEITKREKGIMGKQKKREEV